MTIQAVLAPLFVLVLMTFGIGLWLGYRRRIDIRGRKVRLDEISLREPNWPAPTMQASYSFSNQFELPLLFYVLTILVLITRKADLLFVLLAWIFVVTRVFHAAVHLTSNNIRVRGGIYGAGALILLIMWVVFILRILFAD